MEGSTPAVCCETRAVRSPCISRELDEGSPAQAHVIAAGPGRHLDVPDALLDMVKTYARRAAEADEPLKAFMCVIPKVRSGRHLGLPSTYEGVGDKA